MNEKQRKFLEEYKWERNLILAWGVWVWKTYEAKKIWNRLLKKGEFSPKNNWMSVFFINDTQVRQELSSWNLVLRRNSEYGCSLDKYPLEKIIRTRLLILDDLWVSNITSAYLEKIYFVIDKRINEKKPFIITTNLNMDEIKEKLWSRILSRILFNTDIIQMEGDDRRKETTRLIG